MPEESSETNASSTTTSLGNPREVDDEAAVPAENSKEETQEQDAEVDGGETTFEEGQKEQEDETIISADASSSKLSSMNPFQRWRRGTPVASAREEGSIPAAEIEQGEGIKEEEVVAHANQTAGEDSKESSDESRVDVQKSIPEGGASEAGAGAGAAGRIFRGPFQRWRAFPTENDASKPADQAKVGGCESTATSDQKMEAEEATTNASEQTLSETAEKNNLSEMEPAETLVEKSTNSGFSLNLFRRKWRNTPVNSQEATDNTTESTNVEEGSEEEKEIDRIPGPDSDLPPQATEGEAAASKNSTTLAEKMRKGAVAVAGGTITAVGLVMIPLPTPMGCVVAASGLSLLSTEFEGAKKVQQNCADTLVSTRDTLIDTVERTIDDDGEANEKDPDAICHTEEESGMVISVNADGYFDDDNGFYYEEDEETKRKREQQLQEQQRKANALQNYKKQLGLQTRAYLATSVLPILHKTKGFGSNATSTSDNNVSSER